MGGEERKVRRCKLTCWKLLLKLKVTDFIAALCRSPCFFHNLVGLGRSRMREWGRKAPSILAP